MLVLCKKIFKPLRFGSKHLKLGLIAGQKTLFRGGGVKTTHYIRDWHKFV